MKKFLNVLAITVLAVVMLVLLTGCGKKAIVGDWEYEGGSYTYHFNEDGTGTYGEIKLTYTEENDKIKILFEGWNEPLEARIEGNTLIVVDSFGSDTIYNKK